MGAASEAPASVDLDGMTDPEEEEGCTAAILASQKALAALPTNEDNTNTPLIATLKELAAALEKNAEKPPAAAEEELKRQMDELIFEPSPEDETTFNLSSVFDDASHACNLESSINEENFAYLCDLFPDSSISQNHFHQSYFQNHASPVFSVHNESLTEVNLNTVEEPKLVTILSDQTPDEKREMIKVLKKHVKAFAWSYDDM